MPANRSNRTSLRMVTADGTPLSRRYFSTHDDKLLESDDIIRGYEIEKDAFVVVDDDELDKLAPDRTRDIDLRVFVATDDIDPKHFERAYYLTPGGNSTKAYRLLARVMEDTGRAGIATFVMRGKEYLIAIIAENGILRAETLRFSDEIRGPEDIGLPEPVDLGLREINRIAKDIRKLKEKKMDPADLEERSAARLHAIVEKKLESNEAVVHHEEADTGGTSREVIDLVEMLQRSLQGSGSGDEPVQEKKAKSFSKGGKSASGAARDTKPKSSGSGSKKGSSKATKSSKKPAEKLSSLSKADLYERAQKLDIPGRSSMTKDDLIEAIQSAS